MQLFKHLTLMRLGGSLALPVVIMVWQSCSFAIAADHDAWVMTLQGTSNPGPITGISDGTIRQQAGTATRLTDMLKIETGQPCANVSIKSLVMMTNGDRLAVDIVRLRDDALLCRTFADDDLVIPIEFVRALVLKLPRSTKQRSQLLRLIDDHHEGDDIILIENGDRIVGELLDLEPADAVLATANGEVKAPRAGIRAIMMNIDLAAPIERPDYYQIVVMTDGSSLSVQSPELVDGTLAAKTLFGADFHVSLTRVTAVFARGPRIVPLSQLKPQQWSYTPFISGSRELQLNRNSCQQDLRLSGRRYPQGLGMHSRSASVWNLNGDYELFVADVGIDDLAKGRGSVEFRVVVDDRVEFKTTVVGDAPPQSTGLVNLKNASQMKLEVDYALRGDLFDIADWCEPVLIRK